MWNDGGNGTARIYIRGSWGTVQSMSTTFINDGIWHHVLGIWDGDSTKIYVDGVLEDKDYCPNAPEYVFDNYYRVGTRRANQYFWEGLIDEPSTWNRGLIQAEIDSLVAESQYPFPYQGSGGDSLNMVIEGEDTRADTMYVLWKYTGWSIDTTDGNKLFRFGIDEIEDYRDTTFLSPVRGDSLAYFTAFTKFEALVTTKGNQDTVFVDS